MPGLIERLRALPPDLAAGVPAVLLAIVGFAFGAPTGIALVGAAVVFGVIRLALTPAVFAPLDAGAIKSASDDLTREVLGEARGEMGRLLAAARHVREPFVRAHLSNFYTLGSKVIGEVERRPERLGSVRRLLTYYLPAATRLGEGYQVLEQARTPDGARLSATGSMIKRLYDTCARQADRINETDVDGLDVELKLLDDALGEEERHRPAALAPPHERPLGLPNDGGREPAPVPREDRGGRV